MGITKSKLGVGRNGLTIFDWNNIDCEIIEGDFTIGSKVKVKIDGKDYVRRVYDCPDDLYINIKGYRFYFQDFYKN